MQILDGRSYFYQWDTTRHLTAKNLSVGDEVDFSNMSQRKAIPVTAKEINGKVAVEVPNILLQSSHPIIAYRSITDDNGRFTVEKYVFDVVPKPKPDDYVYTETEVKSYSELEKRIEALENESGDDCDCYSKTEIDNKFKDKVDKSDFESLQREVQDISLGLSVHSGELENLDFRISSLGTSIGVLGESVDGKADTSYVDGQIGDVMTHVYGKANTADFQELKDDVGNIDAALDAILALDAKLLGGDA